MSNEQLISQINEVIKLKKAEEERKRKIQEETFQREEEARIQYIKDIENYFSELEPYRYVVEITDWQTLCILGRWLFIEVTISFGKAVEIWADNVEDSQHITDFADCNLLNLWNYDAVRQLYMDRDKILQAIATKIGL